MSIFEKDGTKIAATLTAASAMAAGFSVYTMAVSAKGQEILRPIVKAESSDADEFSDNYYIEEKKTSTARKTASAAAASTEETTEENTEEPAEELIASAEVRAVEEQPAPVVEEQPAVEPAPAPVVEEQPAPEPAPEPVVEEQPAPEPEQPPVVEEQPPVVEEQPPVVEEQPPVVEEQPPVVEEQPPVVEEQPPVVEEQPPVVEEQPPVVEEQPPVVEEQPPVVEEQPPVVEEQPPVVEEQPAPAPEEPPVEAPADPYADLNARIADEAIKLVGTTDGLQCTEVVQMAMANAGVYDAENLWPNEYADAYGYYTDTPVAGNLIYYNNGGNGVDHIAIYIGDGMAVHGNYYTNGESHTVIANAYLEGCDDYAFIQVCR